MGILQTAPRWCKNAIPTKLGWADPKTGELLICNKHLENPVDGYVRGRPWTPPKQTQTIPVEVVAPKRGRGRPRKHPKPDVNQPKRPRGRPRKHPKPDVNQPKRPRGRPRKHPKPETTN